MSSAREPQCKKSYVSYAAAVKEGSTKPKEIKQSTKASSPARVRQPRLRNSDIPYATDIKEPEGSKEGSRMSYASVVRLSSKAPRKPASTDVVRNIQPPIYKLPDELLMLIFESIYTPGIDGFDFAVRISQISRFRAVALATSRLWSTVSPTQGSDELKEFLERSGTAQLTILIHTKCDEPHSRPEHRERLSAVLGSYYRTKRKFDDNHVVYKTIFPHHHWGHPPQCPCEMYEDTEKFNWDATWFGEGLKDGKALVVLLCRLVIKYSPRQFGLTL